MKTKRTENRAPIGSMWMGWVMLKDGREDVTVVVESDPIPGNDLRMCRITSQGPRYNQVMPIGANAFRYRTGNLVRIS
jgi:hypothetical protein